MLGVINGKIRSSHAPHGAKAVSAHVSRGHKLAASSGASPNGLGAGPQGGVPSLSVGVNWPSQYQYYFTGILPAEPIINDPSSLALFWRDIYLHDAVGGTMVDLQMEFPFSDFILQGVKDKKILQTYIDGVAQLNMREMFPIISWAHLVDGYFCGTLIYDPKTRRFADTMVHDALQTSVRTTPFFNRDPAITVSVSNAVAQFLSTNSDYNREYIESLPEHFQSMLEEGRYDLNPVTTLFVPRRSLTDRSYESYFRRLLPMYLIEKTLYRGTLVEAQRRQRAMTHLTVGTQDWTPNPAELLNTVQNFQAAEADPLGGWIATREGVTANDLRPGGDFWRWMDTADALVPYKLRALGASESFLGGDACLAGHTLIPTTMGLRRIDSMGVGRTRNDSQPLNITVDSRLGKAKTKSWLYNGYRETFAIHTEMGNVVQATNNHPVLVLRNGETVWVRTDKLEVGDLMCISTNKVVRKTPLALRTPKPKARQQLRTSVYARKRTHNPFDAGDMSVPTHMNEDLAQWLAMFISEGWVTKADTTTVEGGATFVGFGNTDSKAIDLFVALSRSLFNVESDIDVVEPHNVNAQPSNIKSGVRANKTYYRVRIHNRRLVDWLAAIGCYVGMTVDGVTPSNHKVIPWSILEADEQSQVAFMATYAECDGNIAGERTTWCSVSQTLLDQLVAMLNAHGFQPHRSERQVVLNADQADSFWNQGKKYLITKTVPAGKQRLWSKQYGVPVQHWKEFLESRRLYSNRHGTFYAADDGSEVQWSANTNGTRMRDVVRVNFDFYNEGRYDAFLELLRQVSIEEYNKLRFLLEHPYLYTPVKSIVPMGKTDVFDISMVGDPSFVANGLVVHNTFDNQATSYSMFLEGMSAYRQKLTTRIFYHRVFPMIAIINGFYKDKTHRNKSLSDYFYNATDRENLVTPSVHWKKNLDVVDDTGTFDMLERASEHGVPVTLRRYIVAAGMDPESIISEMEQDADLRRRVEEITGKSSTHESLEDDDDYGLEASTWFKPSRNGNAPRMPTMSASQLKQHKVPLLARDFGNSAEPHNISRTGKKKAVPSMLHAERRQKENSQIVKVAQAMRDPNFRREMALRNQKRFGTSKHDLGSKM